MPWCPGCPVLCTLRAWLLGVCVSLALLCALLSWPACVPVAWCCGAVLCPAPWCVGLLCLPCGLGLCVGLVYRPLISPCYMGLFLRPCISGLIWASEKMLYFRLVFRLCISGLFSGFVFALKFPARFSGPQRLDFFLRIFSRRFFRRKFPGYFFRALFSGIFPGLIFASISGFLFFLDVIFVRFPVFRDELFHVVKFQELVHGGLVDPVALAF